MLVYGDCRRTVRTQKLIAALRNDLWARPATGGSVAREWATTLLLETGELIQGLLDAFDARAKGGDPGLHDPAYRNVALGAARLYLAEFEPESRPPLRERAIRFTDETLDHLSRCELPADVEIRT